MCQTPDHYYAAPCIHQSLGLDMLENLRGSAVFHDWLLRYESEFIEKDGDWGRVKVVYLNGDVPMTRS